MASEHHHQQEVLSTLLQWTMLVGLPVGEPTASRIAVVLDWAAALTR